MSTTPQAATSAAPVTIDLNDIVFEHKNREYGAYVLRKRYPRFLSYSVIIASLFFVIVLSSPLIITFIKEKTAKKEELNYNAQQMFDLNTIQKEKEKDKEEIEKPKEQVVKTTLEFVAPKVVADEDVKEAYVAPKEDAELGKVTAKADENINLSDIDLPTPTATSSGPAVEVEKEKPFTFVEEMPTFPGGNDALMSFFGQNIKYPEIARRAGVEGKVYIQFVVGRDGSITSAQVAKGIGAGCDEEAIRVVKLMPKWNAGKQNGRTVLVQVVVPIIFKLQ